MLFCRTPTCASRADIKSKALVVAVCSLRACVAKGARHAALCALVGREGASRADVAGVGGPVATWTQVTTAAATATDMQAAAECVLLRCANAAGENTQMMT